MNGPEFKYCGNHQRHRPDSRVVEVVAKILFYTDACLEKRVTAVVEHEDYEDQYRITLALESKVFVVIFFDPREITCVVRELISGSRKTIYLPFEFDEDMRNMIVASYVLLIKQKLSKIQHLLEEIGK